MGLAKLAIQRDKRKRISICSSQEKDGKSSFESFLEWNNVSGSFFNRGYSELSICRD